MSNAATSSPARELIAKGGILLDVRTPEEFTAGHLPGAINIPVQQFSSRMGELGNDPARPVVLYCRSGARSAMAASMLRSAGFQRVLDISTMSAY